MSAEILKLMTCGSVDDGKSTLLGRLLYETNNIYDDQTKQITNLSKQYKKPHIDIDYSLLLDGLIDEKEQGITIDVAFKYFKLAQRDIMLIDSPGHQEFTKNMANACTFANSALLLIDSSKKIQIQTLKHMEILAMFPNIKSIIVCFNKIDKINYDFDKFDRLKEELSIKLQEINLDIKHMIPISALKGDNITTKSKKTPYYKGKSLKDILINLEIKNETDIKDKILAIKFVDNSIGKRMYAVEHTGVKLNKNETMFSFPNNKEVKIKKIYKNLEESTYAKNENVMIELSEQIHLNKSQYLTTKNSIEFSDSFKGKLFWFSKNPLLMSKRFLIKFKNDESYGFISNTYKDSLGENEIDDVTIELEKKLGLNGFKENYSLSQFIIIDPLDNETVGFGYVIYSLDRGSTVIKTNLSKFKSKFTPKTIWMTGLPGSGKTTIANELGKKFQDVNMPFIILDGDNVRSTINKDLGFSRADRIENNRRIAYLSKLISESGVYSIVSTVSPYFEIRDFARSIHKNTDFAEVYVYATLETCLERDPKNLYKNKNKKNKNITGLHEVYEAPNNPEIILNTEKFTINKTVDQLFKFLTS